MRFASAHLVCLSLLGLACARATPDASADNLPPMPSAPRPPMSNEQAAESTGRAWLALVDAGKYAQTWADAAALFKKSIDQPTWQKQVDGVRSPLGKLLSRKTTSRRYTKTVPGGPDGDYVILMFETRFENKQSALETVTPMKDPDGSWRVSGYFIR